jgi:hypothetical protein
MPRPPHPPWLDYSNYTWRRVQITKLLITQFSPPSRLFETQELSLKLGMWCGYGPERLGIMLHLEDGGKRFVRNVVTSLGLKGQQSSLSLTSGPPRSLVTQRTVLMLRAPANHPWQMSDDNASTASKHKLHRIMFGRSPHPDALVAFRLVLCVGPLTRTSGYHKRVSKKNNYCRLCFLLRAALLYVGFQCLSLHVSA